MSREASGSRSPIAVVARRPSFAAHGRRPAAATHFPSGDTAIAFTTPAFPGPIGTRNDPVALELALHAVA